MAAAGTAKGRRVMRMQTCRLRLTPSVAILWDLDWDCKWPVAAWRSCPSGPALPAPEPRKNVRACLLFGGSDVVCCTAVCLIMPRGANECVWGLLHILFMLLS